VGTRRSPLALLPGLLGDAGTWEYQARHLGDVAEIWIADFQTQETIAAMAVSVLDVMPERFALAGFSMGGYVALEVMRRAPKRVTRLALVDTSARPDSLEQTELRRKRMESVRDGDIATLMDEMLPFSLHPNRLSEPGLRSPIVEMAVRIGKETFLRQQRAIIARPDSRPGLGAILCPSLVLCGRQDLVTPLEVHEEMARLIPTSQLSIVEECGHFSPLERPHAVTTVMRLWL
jgi:pimeloyl-ACP methyl ester carboxylesterase